MSLPSRRVVVTGIGLVTPLGCGVNYVWQRILQGECGISAIEDSQFSRLPCQIAAFVPRGTNPGELNIETHLKPSESRNMSTATIYALIAAQEAINNAKLDKLTESEKQKTGVAIGMGMTDLEEISNTGSSLKNHGYNRVSPHFVTKILNNIAAGHISIKHGFRGPNHCVSTACTTGLHAIGDASRFIQFGDADRMVCGGTEACIGPLSIAAFCRIRALATKFNKEPNLASRPFDTKREGFVMGEGAGVLVLENYETAMLRGADIYGEILGYGLSGDAHHVTSPNQNGLGAHNCMNSAIQKASVDKKAIGYINAHATSTPIGDDIESKAIKQLFGAHAGKMAISSTKGATGHLLGAAGAVEAIFTIMACKTGLIPPTINLEHADDADLNYVPQKMQPWPHIGTEDDRIALTNSFGFGGTNASLCIRHYRE